MLSIITDLLAINCLLGLVPAAAHWGVVISRGVRVDQCTVMWSHNHGAVFQLRGRVVCHKGLFYSVNEAPAIWYRVRPIRILIFEDFKKQYLTIFFFPSSSQKHIILSLTFVMCNYETLPR